MEHKKNEWGIEIVSDSSKEKKEEKVVKVEESESVEGLMAELNKI